MTDHQKIEEQSQGFLGKTVSAIKEAVTAVPHKIGEMVNEFVHEVQEKKEELDRQDQEKTIAHEMGSDFVVPVDKIKTEPIKSSKRPVTTDRCEQHIMDSPAKQRLKWEQEGSEYLRECERSTPLQTVQERNQTQFIHETSINKKEQRQQQINQYEISEKKQEKPNQKEQFSTQGTETKQENIPEINELRNYLNMNRNNLNQTLFNLEKYLSNIEKLESNISKQQNEYNQQVRQLERNRHDIEMERERISQEREKIKLERERFEFEKLKLRHETEVKNKNIEVREHTKQPVVIQNQNLKEEKTESVNIPKENIKSENIENLQNLSFKEKKNIPENIFLNKGEKFYEQFDVNRIKSDITDTDSVFVSKEEALITKEIVDKDVKQELKEPLLTKKEILDEDTISESKTLTDITHPTLEKVDQTSDFKESLSETAIDEKKLTGTNYQQVKSGVYSSEIKPVETRIENITTTKTETLK